MAPDPAASPGGHIEGELSFARVPHWLAQADALAASGTLDLSQVSRADSAGLALLLELTRRAKASGKPLRLSNPPAQLLGLSEFFGLSTLLRFN